MPLVKNDEARKSNACSCEVAVLDAGGDPEI